MIASFPHKAPDNYSYEFESFKRNIIAIWLRHHSTYDYNLGKPVRTIWGFYNTKTETYYSPSNKCTVGSPISIDKTRNYTSMQIKKTPLELCFS